jgi:hypothetical protein
MGKPSLVEFKYDIAQDVIYFVLLLYQKNILITTFLNFIINERSDGERPNSMIHTIFERRKCLEHNMRSKFAYIASLHNDMHVIVMLPINIL